MSGLYVKDAECKKILGGDYELCIKVPTEDELSLSSFCSEIKNSPFPLSLKLEKEKPLKSNSSNAYLWVLCDKIAKKIGHVTKEDIYKEAVRHAGKFDINLILKVNLKTAKEAWESKGTGWLIDVLEDTGEMVEAFYYYGSSVYSQEELNHLIDYLYDQAEELGIDLEKVKKGA